MTPRQQAPHTFGRRRIATVTLIVAAALAVTGCSSPTTASSEPSQALSQSAATSSVASPKTEPTKTPTAAEAFSQRVKGSLTKLGNATKAPNREQMMAAMLEAGATKDKVEISIDITPTGLAVDAIESAVPIASNCVIGQVRDGKVAVTILPILASGKCFVGDQH